jgi:superoxide dismutase, Fe-Mn family
MKHQLPKLQFEYNSLEPFIDAKTMEIHHSKHHQAYVDKLNIALEKNPELQNKKVEELLKNLEKIPEEIRLAIKNNAGGHFNHTFFWQILKKNTKFSGEISKEIEKTFTSFIEFKEKLTNAAITQFGSGWAWLVYNKKTKKLEIIKTSNQDSPISQNLIPIITIDVWEHAYYLKYQNKRPEYIEAFFNVIDWKKANELFLEAKKN